MRAEGIVAAFVLCCTTAIKNRATCLCKEIRIRIRVRVREVN
jgi:hypothetical protein